MLYVNDSELSIVECADVIYKSSKSKCMIDHKTTWRKKYIGLIGRIFIVKLGEHQFFQWHPINDKNELIYDKGMVSSNDEYEFVENELKITTDNSFYVFEIIKKIEEKTPPPIIW